jgi:hypothetical protein
MLIWLKMKDKPINLLALLCVADAPVFQGDTSKTKPRSTLDWGPGSSILLSAQPLQKKKLMSFFLACLRTWQVAKIVPLQLARLHLILSTMDTRASKD